MPEVSRDAGTTRSTLEGSEEYQAPPREHEQDVSALPAPHADDPVDAPLLGAKQEGNTSTMSGTRPRATPDPTSTVSTRDERSDPADPRKTPPGERM